MFRQCGSYPYFGSPRSSTKNFSAVPNFVLSPSNVVKASICKKKVEITKNRLRKNLPLIGNDFSVMNTNRQKIFFREVAKMFTAKAIKKIKHAVNRQIFFSKNLKKTKILSGALYLDRYSSNSTGVLTSSLSGKIFNRPFNLSAPNFELSPFRNMSTISLLVALNCFRKMFTLRLRFPSRRFTWKQNILGGGQTICQCACVKAKKWKTEKIFSNQDN